MVSRLMISGACLRPNGYDLGEGKYYGKAVMLVLDVNTGKFEEVLSKSNGGENYPAEHPNLQYTAACLDGEVLWLPTDTELYKYNLPDFELLTVYSHPSFQNVHSVHVFDDDLVVTSTGLDQIIIMEKQSGNIKQIMSALDEDPWSRFDSNKDYRKVHSTRPHRAHPNFVFKLDGSYWTTRCKQEDAVNLDDFSQLIDLSGNIGISVHDGMWWNQNLVFTRVDGLIIICNPEERKVIENIDPFEGRISRPYGWCRGLYLDGNSVYVGFSALRKTRTIAKLKYLARGNIKYLAGNQALIVKYDIAKRRLEKVFSVEDSIDAVYGITPFNY